MVGVGGDFFLVGGVDVIIFFWRNIYIIFLNVSDLKFLMLLNFIVGVFKIFISFYLKVLRCVRMGFYVGLVVVVVVFILFVILLGVLYFIIVVLYWGVLLFSLDCFFLKMKI